MKTVEEFILEVESSLQKYFPTSRIEFLLRTAKSLKCNVYLQENLFIAIRFNARNERTDFALISNNQRVFGFDNLKQWHYHPYENPDEHIPCGEPTITKIVSEICLIAERIM